jgi:hypothetical protein
MFDTALSYVSDLHIQSPIKLLLRQLDKFAIESRDEFEFVEPYLLRFIHHFPHSIDYVCMIVGARVLRGKQISARDWAHVIESEAARYIRLAHHQEVAWLLWLAIIAGIKLEDSLIDRILGANNAHLSAMVIAASTNGVIQNRIALADQGTADIRTDEWLMLHEAAIAGILKRPVENDELELHRNLIAQNVSFLDFSAVKDKLTGTGSVINGIRFGYEDDDKEPSAEPEKIVPVFQASTQDF